MTLIMDWLDKKDKKDKPQQRVPLPGQQPLPGFPVDPVQKKKAGAKSKSSATATATASSGGEHSSCKSSIKASSQTN